MPKPPSGRVAVYGESLIDLISPGEMTFNGLCGGSPYNVARALGIQRIPTSYLAPLSQDQMGDRLRASLAEAGVDAAAPASPLPTSLALVTTDADGQPSYSLYRQGVADRDIDLATLQAIVPDDTRICHCGSLTLIPEEIDKTQALIAHLRQRQDPPLIVVDLNLRPPVVNDSSAYAAAIASVLPHADIIKLSDEDLAALPYGADPAAAAPAIAALAKSVAVIITLGGQGCLAQLGDQQLMMPLPATVEVVDSVGAGDCFQAGLIAWLYTNGATSADALAGLDQEQWRQALRHAGLTAACNVRHAGCCPPTPKEIDELAAQSG